MFADVFRYDLQRPEDNLRCGSLGADHLDFEIDSGTGLDHVR